MFLNDKREGFGRNLWPNGDYYIGLYRNNVKHGQGLLVCANGLVQQGVWESNEFKYPKADATSNKDSLIDTSKAANVEWYSMK